MTAFLLDINVLVALAWPDHFFHSPATRWFARRATQGWATCPITQTGMVRILSNPAFSDDAITPSDALLLLGRSLQHDAHQFWRDDLTLRGAFELAPNFIHGHQQITDAYLVALAMRNKGKLATLDRKIAANAPPGVVEVIT